MSDCVLLPGNVERILISLPVFVADNIPPFSLDSFGNIPASNSYVQDALACADHTASRGVPCGSIAFRLISHRKFYTLFPIAPLTISTVSLIQRFCGIV